MSKSGDLPRVRNQENKPKQIPITSLSHKQHNKSQHARTAQFSCYCSALQGSFQWAKLIQISHTLYGWKAREMLYSLGYSFAQFGYIYLRL